jgi:hypothetical protein
VVLALIAETGIAALQRAVTPRGLRLEGRAGAKVLSDDVEFSDSVQ